MSELVDLVDRNGTIQMYGVPRHEVAKHPDLHMQIVIVVAFDGLGRMLVHRRGENKKVDRTRFDHICGAIIQVRLHMRLHFAKAKKKPVLH